MSTATKTKPMDVNTTLNDKIDFWIEHDLNVLFTGTQGVGKSTIMEESFRRNNVNYKYFTASLMDPYLTLIGVPKEQKNEKTGESFLEYIKPKEFSTDADYGVEAIFFDEFNRAGPAVRNAVMELIQFKSINGVRLPNLRFVWAAINPADDEETFDVHELDPAQKDRFHVQYVLENKPCPIYFKDKFGSHIAKVAIKWWNAIPEEINKHVSPRRLDYALEMYQRGGDVSDSLVPDSRPADLIRKLQDMTAGEGSNIDRWASDPQSFLNEITDRNDPMPDDKVVEAFRDLKNYSIDMSVDLVASLLPEQLRALTQQHDTVDILLRNMNGIKSETVKSALEEGTWYEQHRDFVYDRCEKASSAEFSKAFKDGDLDGMLQHKGTGYTYQVILMWAKDNMDEFPMDIMRDMYKEKPKLLVYLTQWDYELSAKLFEAKSV